MKWFIIVFFIEALNITCANSATPTKTCQVNRKDGTCVDFKKCPEVREAYMRHNIKPVICDTVPRTVCCPNKEEIVVRARSTRISAQSMKLLIIL